MGSRNRLETWAGSSARRGPHPRGPAPCRISYSGPPRKHTPTRGALPISAYFLVLFPEGKKSPYLSKARGSWEVIFNTDLRKPREKEKDTESSCVKTWDLKTFWNVPCPPLVHAGSGEDSALRGRQLKSELLTEQWGT